MQYNEDMYSRVKRVPRAANHYKNYRATTVSSAKRTRNGQPPRHNRYSNIPSSDGMFYFDQSIGCSSLFRLVRLVFFNMTYCKLGLC